MRRYLTKTRSVTLLAILVLYSTMSACDARTTTESMPTITTTTTTRPLTTTKANPGCPELPRSRNALLPPFKSGLGGLGMLDLVVFQTCPRAGRRVTRPVLPGPLCVR